MSEKRLRCTRGASLALSDSRPESGTAKLEQTDWPETLYCNSRSARRPPGKEKIQGKLHRNHSLESTYTIHWTLAALETSSPGRTGVPSFLVARGKPLQPRPPRWFVRDVFRMEQPDQNSGGGQIEGERLLPDRHTLLGHNWSGDDRAGGIDILRTDGPINEPIRRTA